ncbi:MAG TPA: hypothetical protein PLM60_09455 [Methanoregulaceae archaeon]|jgi:hypothetical protein|nr:hypothetical protein [Methanoregulaceae archaeon]HPS23614.1 hypothetical protein [Methanoregulaceae archaeon]
MRYLVFTALALVLLVGASSALPNEVTATIVTTATGGDVYQEAYNYVDEASGDVTETITMVADATGEVTQDGDNEAYVDSDGAVVTQSISMDATGEDIYQNWYSWGNYAEVTGEGTTIIQSFMQNANAENYVYQYASNEADQEDGSLSMTTQTIEQTAVAGGDIDQYAYNDAYFYGDGNVAFQSVFMDANAGGWAYQDGYNYVDMYGDDGWMSTMVDQSATLNAIAGDWVYQDFYNDIPYATGGSVNDQAITMSGTAGTDVDQYLYNYIDLWNAVSEDNQVLSAAAFAADGYVYQDAYNEIDYGTDDGITWGNELASQSISLSGVATGDVEQIGWNWADLDDNAVLGQLVSMGGDGAFVEQDAYNDAYFGYSATVAQALEFSAISDDEGVDQYGYNYAENYWDDGGATSSIGQSISAAATGGDTSYQDFYNIAALDYNWAPGTYNVVQSNVATLAATDDAYQWMYNWVYWWNPNTGSVAMDILGDASADYVYQYHENWIG